MSSYDEYVSIEEESLNTYTSTSAHRHHHTHRNISSSSRSIQREGSGGIGLVASSKNPKTVSRSHASTGRIILQVDNNNNKNTLSSHPPSGMSDAGNASVDDKNASRSDLGMAGSTSVIVAFVLSQVTVFFALNIVQALSSIWPSDFLLLMTCLEGFLLWYDLIRIIDYILSKHPNERWTEAWRKMLAFISYILIFICAAYAIQMLRLLWISGIITTIQSIMVTIIGISAVVFIFVIFSDQFLTRDRTHLQKEIQLLLKNHVRRSTNNAIQQHKNQYYIKTTNRPSFHTSSSSVYNV